MKTALRLTIQCAWAYVGLISCSILAGLLWVSLARRNPPAFAHGEWAWQISNALGILLAVLILALIIRAAYRAIFRFSEKTVNDSVSLTLVVMVGFYIYANHYYLGPWITTWIRAGRSPLLPLMDVVFTVASLAGCYKFGLVMPGLLRKVLFPERQNSWARFV